MKKCRDNECEMCCYECNKKNKCDNVHCVDNNSNEKFDYESCFFFIDTENIKYAKLE